MHAHQGGNDDGAGRTAPESGARDHSAVRLLVRRHAESEWNAQARIQGDNTAPPLTEAGAAEAARWAAGLPDDAAGPRTIWSSDAVRAHATAGAAARRFGLPVVSTALLGEAGAGVLEGLTHAEAAARFPAHHRVWTARGDLDAIPGAEPGDRLQARVVAFLAAATGPGGADLYGTSQLVVTHAAFLRCLVNTAHLRPRSTPVAVAHDDVHRLDDPWRALSPGRLGPTWRPAVHRVDTADGTGYVVKVLPGLGTGGGLRRYRDLQRTVCAATGTPPLLAATARADGSAVTVRPFVPGAALGHRLGPDTEWELLRFYDDFNARLATVTVTGPVMGLRSLGDRVDRALRGPDDEAVRQLRALAADSRLDALFHERTHITDFDLHRDNTLRTDGGRLVRIDLDSLCPGPRLWGRACALVGASALYPGGPGDPADRPHVRLLGGGSDHARELRHLVRARLLLGLRFFLALPGGGEGYAALYRAALTELTALDRSGQSDQPDRFDRLDRFHQLDQQKGGHAR
ncbi:histidine phosphatase family protein [Streptomyces fuscichromogenes]|uniref:histidine phosphatase family protein n=1 Tax=Streptomyces fuscichromogenes TaxID=1324013 RepID=UPI0037F4A0C1